MPDTQHHLVSSDEQIEVTLKLDPEVYQFFHEKARKAEVGIEAYLASTLSIVLGCKAFNKMSACSPQTIAEARQA